jgi:hypothetical protein
MTLDCAFAGCAITGLAACAGAATAEVAGRAIPERAIGKTVDRRMLMLANLDLRAGENKTPR